MKKLAYLTLIAAFVFGAQTQEAFSANDHSIEMERVGEGSAKIVFDQNSETLNVLLFTKGKEKAQISLFLRGVAVAKETVMIYEGETHFAINMEGMEGGKYTVKVVSPSIELKEQFRKK